MLIGPLFLNPVIGAAVGAASGAHAGKLSDMGMSDRTMKELAASFMPGLSPSRLPRKCTIDPMHGGRKT